jgi:hypothetical protein
MAALQGLVSLNFKCVADRGRPNPRCQLTLITSEMTLLASQTCLGDLLPPVSFLLLCLPYPGRSGTTTGPNPGVRLARGAPARFGRTGADGCHTRWQRRGAPARNVRVGGLRAGHAGPGFLPGVHPGDGGQVGFIGDGHDGDGTEDGPCDKRRRRESRAKPVSEAERVSGHARVFSTTEASMWCQGVGCQAWRNER